MVRWPRDAVAPVTGLDRLGELREHGEDSLEALCRLDELCVCAPTRAGSVRCGREEGGEAVPDGVWLG